MPYYKLKGYLVSHNLKQSDYAKILGISRILFNRKINKRGTDFTMTEVNKLLEYDSNLTVDCFYNI